LDVHGALLGVIGLFWGCICSCVGIHRHTRRRRALLNIVGALVDIHQALLGIHQALLNI